jgi:hypothetical protein
VSAGRSRRAASYSMQGDCVEFKATATATVESRSSNSWQVRSWILAATSELIAAPRSPLTSEDLACPSSALYRSAQLEPSRDSAATLPSGPSAQTRGRLAMEPTTRANAKARLVNLGIHGLDQQERCLSDPCAGGRFSIPRLHISWARADKMCAAGADIFRSGRALVIRSMSTPKTFLSRQCFLQWRESLRMTRLVLRRISVFDDLRRVAAWRICRGCAHHLAPCEGTGSRVKSRRKLAFLRSLRSSRKSQNVVQLTE